ncbi:MAG TPA: hypothetical protein VFM36_16515 [Thermoanaerobaculia bacterium]|nr:hypothetical protein [Thermoanaerobaculia bacterium]
MSLAVIRWAVAVAVSAWAAALIVRHPTPIDGALPFIVIVMTVVAAVTHSAILLSVPLLLLGEIVFPDEPLRLLWFGIVLAVSFAAAVWIRENQGTGSRGDAETRGSISPVIITIAAILLLRWIPLEPVLIGREVFLLAVAATTVMVLGSTPIAITVAVAAALFTPAVPMRTLIVPIGVLMLSVAARMFGSSRVALPTVAAALLALPMLFFAWSGAFARALPVMLRGGPPRLERVPVRIALAAGQSAEVDVPRDGRGVILSGANVPKLRRGTIVGTVEPGHIVVRIGDVADWGVLRRDHYYASRNPLPRRPGGILRGYGHTAWIDASGRIAVRPGTVVVTADRNLPSGASLQIDAIELAR